MVAVHGSGYCTSAFKAAKLILNNILRIAAVNVVGDALLWLGKVACCHSIQLMFDLSCQPALPCRAACVHPN